MGFVVLFKISWLSCFRKMDVLQKTADEISSKTGGKVSGISI